MDGGRDIAMDGYKGNLIRIEKNIKREKMISRIYNKLLPQNVLFDMKSGFVKRDSEIPEPIYILDLEYRIRLYNNINK